MLQNETTFIIGAGASCDFEFPIGTGLRDSIIEILAVEPSNQSFNFKDPVIATIMREQSAREAGSNQFLQRLQDYCQAAQIIREGLPYARSIDSFLDSLRDAPDVRFLGKLAIATAILRAEASAPLIWAADKVARGSEGLYEPGRSAVRAKKLKQVTDSWHAQLGQILFEGHTRDTLEAVFSNVSFVVFNYDRCVEEFLTIALMRRFDVARNAALDLVQKCRIIHPYGSAGGYFPDRDGFVAFGDIDGERLVSVGEQIKTYTESMHDHVVEGVRGLIANAETIVFMGFGWLPKNMELLGCAGRKTKARKVFATTKEMEQGEVAIVGDQIARMLSRDRFTPRGMAVEARPSFTTNVGDCRALMTKCWLRLTSD